jgi:hypothetical protein
VISTSCRSVDCLNEARSKQSVQIMGWVLFLRRSMLKSPRIRVSCVGRMDERRFKRRSLNWLNCSVAVRLE